MNYFIASTIFAFHFHLLNMETFTEIQYLYCFSLSPLKDGEFLEMHPVFVSHTYNCVNASLKLYICQIITGVSDIGR